MHHYIDMHCDTLLHSVMPKGCKDLYEISGTSVDLKRMREGGTLAQFFAVFFPPRFSKEEGKKPPFELPCDEEFFAGARAVLQTSLREHSGLIGAAGCETDILENQKEGKMSAILTIEDGRMVQGSMERLIQLHQEGVRAIALTWNYENCFGYPNSKDPDIMKRGLTKFGKEAVEVMNDLGILIDVSHLSDGGFFDVASLSKKPFAATHSNCRALTPHTRNLDDGMIRILAEKGGVSGINFGPEFLSPSASGESRVSDMTANILHFIQVGGEDCVGIGTDFDGIRGTLEIGQPTQMHLLFEALKKAGLSERQIDKIAYGNVLRVIRESMKGSLRQEK